MAKRAQLPIETKAIRFAPGRNDKPLTAIWKVWAQGNEVYAATRSSGGSIHISVHESGQVHQRLGTKQKQDLAPVMPLASQGWLHAFEIRFLWSPGVFSPVGPRPSKNKDWLVVETPEGLVLHANLIIGVSATALDSPLPVELAGQTLWRTRLPNGRIAVLVGRLLPLDEKNREHIRYFREELKPNVTVSSMPAVTYFEAHHILWSNGGNIVLVIPMGDEAYRLEQEVPNNERSHSTVRRFHYRSPNATVDLIAPNRDKVAVVEVAGVEETIELTKGLPKLVELGSLTLRLEPDNLIAGSSIPALAPRRLICIPSVGGGSPHSWEYTINSRFDGSSFAAEVPQLSVALQNKNLAQAVDGLDEGEEIVMVIPAETLKITATFDQPSTSTKFVGRFTLRDRR
jgi:hypothetical protein